MQRDYPGYKCSNTVEQRMAPRGSNDDRLTDTGTTSFVPTMVSFLSLLPLTVTVLVSWLTYDCSDKHEMGSRRHMQSSSKPRLPCMP